MLNKVGKYLLGPLFRIWECGCYVSTLISVVSANLLIYVRESTKFHIILSTKCGCQLAFSQKVLVPWHPGRWGPAYASQRLSELPWGHMKISKTVCFFAEDNILFKTELHITLRLLKQFLTAMHEMSLFMFFHQLFNVEFFATRSYITLSRC